MSNHGSPSNIDHTSYGRYVNWQGQHATNRGIINNYQYSHSNPLEELRKHSSTSAAFDSAARFDPPRCAASTRLGIIRVIKDWITSDEDEASLFWLYGGAGSGKSAIAQSLSEEFEYKELAATFFFSGGGATRNNGDNLVPTLISQLVQNFKEILPFVEARISEKWDIFSKIHRVQIRELLVEPLLSLKFNATTVTPPRLIVIDGLDECEHPTIQCELLRAIARSIPRIPYPLRFLVTSRPEAHIINSFDHDADLQCIAVHRCNLSNDPDADMDIRRFLADQFVNIVHDLGKQLPDTWPGQKAISSIVERSSGRFIYASTVIRYIRSPKHRPDDRLEAILRLRRPQGDRPFAQLDALYTLIFKDVESRDQLEKICLVIGINYFQSISLGLFRESDTCPTIENLLEMKAGDLVLLLDPIHSLIVTDGNKVRILHKSLLDYLLDSARSGHLPFDLARVHEVVATYILTHMSAQDVFDLRDLRSFAFHCQYAHLNETLKSYLNDMVVPYPTSPMTSSATIPPWDEDLNMTQQQMIWCFLRTLSREDFDSTSQVYEQYTTKWMDYLHPPVPRRKVDVLLGLLKRKPRNTSVMPNPEDLATLKHKLDNMLREWKPRKFNLVAVEIDPVRRLAYIEQEHRIFSAYVKASFSDNTDRSRIISSLVFGDNFIHSCNFASVGGSLLSIRTYSRHRNVCFSDARDGDPDPLEAMLNYLREAESYFSSDHYQKYGLS